jgi:hypothetical protein
MDQVNAREALRLLPDDYRNGVREVVPESTPEQIAENEAIRLQAMGAGVNVITDGKTLARRVTLRTRYEHAPDSAKEGRQFRIADRVGLMPLIEFAFHANSGMSTSDMSSMAAIYEMLMDCIDPEEWDAFRRYSKEIKADTDDLMEVIQQTTELLTANPTLPQSDFSPQSPPTSGTTTDTSSGQRAGLVKVSELGKLASLG